MSKNREIAALLEEAADLIEFLGEGPFRAIAFRNAARSLEATNEDVVALARESRLKEIQGVGKGIADRIGEYLETGAIHELEELRSRVPSGLVAMTRVQGVGPKTLLMLHEKLGISSLKDMKEAIEAGKLTGLPGIGEKKIETIRKGIEVYERASERLSLAEAKALAESVVASLRKVAGVKRLEAAGSLRRWKETIGDIDIVCSAENASAVLERFVSLDVVSDIFGRGPTKASIRTDKGRQIDLRVVAEESYGAALQYFTGSKAHNVKIREIAQGLGLKVNEYGVFRGDEAVGGREEKDVYAAVGLPWIPPELREDTGEVEAAREGRLPNLVTLEDVKGDLHLHSTWSDGTLSIETLVALARELGYQYIVISDHSQLPVYANGLTPERLREQWEEIRRIRKSAKGIEILASSEVDILADGSLDFPDEILRELDWVIASIHSGFKQNVTERMKRAMENPYVDTIAHPTGRILSRREGYDVDIEQVIAHAADTGTALEINCYPERLDLSDGNARRASARGARITLGTDTHHTGNIDFMEYGVRVARRAGLTARDIVNCRDTAALKSGRKRWRGVEAPIAAAEAAEVASASAEAPAEPSIPPAPEKPATPATPATAKKPATPETPATAKTPATPKTPAAKKKAAPKERGAAGARRTKAIRKSGPAAVKKSGARSATPRRGGRKGPSSRS